MASNPPPRPQIGIERLPPKRTASEPKELMNCKSCRKRKIKCNRLRPSCEACHVFGVPCIYDAVPKKRGPKTDVLEALLKRIDGLERQLQPEDEAAMIGEPDRGEGSSRPAEAALDSFRNATQTGSTSIGSDDAQDYASSTSPNVGSNLTESQSHEGWIMAVELDHVIDHLLSTYFSRLDGKPFYLLDESSLRARLRETGPSAHHLAICSLAARLSTLFGEREQALLASNHYATRARQILDVDEPSIDNIMTLLLLSQHAFQAAQGQKAFMHLSSAISMAFALNLHRELPPHATATVQDRDVRRMVFWTCYLLDRFYSCGSKRPSLISDDSIVLRLPSVIDMNGMTMESSFFMGASNSQYMGSLKTSHNTTGFLVEVVKILGITNKYLAAGGPKADSHFPWHSLSMLAKIRQELDIWAAETTEIFASLDIIFSHKENTILLLSKLIYHLIHCLIYRPFLPVDLVELSGSSQHQSWRIEATKLCFLHANTIAELVEIWKSKTLMADLPAFVGYCIATAGTVHAHGAYYRSSEGQVFSQSAEFCSLEIRQLNEMRYNVASLQHQLDTVQSVYMAQNELSRSFASSAGHVSAVVNYNDFFDRYQGQVSDGAFLSLNYLTSSEESSTSIRSHRRQSSHKQVSITNPARRPRQYRTSSYTSVGTPARSLSPSGGGKTGKRRIPSSHPRSQGTTLRRARHSSASLGSPRASTAEMVQSGSDTDSAPMSDTEGFEPYDIPSLPLYQADYPAFSTMSSMANYLDNSEHVTLIPHTQGSSTAPAVQTHAQADAQDESDPFLIMLEQLAQNVQHQGGQSDLDILLSSGG